MERRWKLAFAAAVFNDLFDLTGIGSIPLLGDVLDLATSAALWKIMGGRRTLPTLLEFIPGLDILPIYTATVTWSYYTDQKKPGKHEEREIKVK